MSISKGNQEGIVHLDELKAELERLGDPARATHSLRYFKAGPGEYAEGDRFRGIATPDVRALFKTHRDATLPDALALLDSPYNEDRALALLFMVRLFEKGDEDTRGEVFRAYLGHTDRINNWNLVDLSAPQIVGGWLHGRSTVPLSRLAGSPSLWERRIALLATFHFIRRGEFAETFRIADLLLYDREDLIHKAAGWMLREVGKRDREALEAFLAPRYRRMPRTMLRYAIEKFPEERRRAYLEGRV